MSKTSPDHYKFGRVEVIEITQHLDFLRGNAVKYLCRAGKKNGESALDDLMKAQYYINKAVEKETCRVALEKAFVSDHTVESKSREIVSRSEEPLGLVMIKHLVMFSGGACSYMAAKRVIERHGKDGVVLLFADTLIEDPTLYEFLDSSSKFLDVPLIKISDGRTPFEVFEDVRFLGNSRIDPCSRILKRDLLNKWREDSQNYLSLTMHLNLTLTQRRCKFTMENTMLDTPLN